METGDGRPTALVVDDDPGVRAALQVGLAEWGLNVWTAADGRHGLFLITSDPPPDVVVLDVSMPGMSGVDLVQQVRASGLTIPVCMLSARDEVDDRVNGLAAGADDYVVKPFSVEELAARLHAMVKLRRVSGFVPIVVGDVTIDPRRRVVSRAGRDIGVTTREFDLLIELARHRGQVLSRIQLLQLVWGYTWEVESNVVDVFVGYLRRKLEGDGEPRLIHTVRGVGFVLRA